MISDTVAGWFSSVSMQRKRSSSIMRILVCPCIVTSWNMYEAESHDPAPLFGYGYPILYVAGKDMSIFLLSVSFLRHPVPVWGPQHLIQYSHITGGCTTWKTQGPSHRKSSICIFRAYANRNGLTRPSAAPASEWANCGSSQRRRCVLAGFRSTTSASAAPPFCRRPCGRSSKATWRCKKRTAEPVFVTKTGRPLDR